MTELISILKASFAVGLGGFFGAITRFSIASLFSKFALPWGTFIANMLGCFLIGFLKAWFDQNNIVSPIFSLAILTGFLGSLTTFSTFSFETNILLQSDWKFGIIYLFFSLIFGLGLVFFGGKAVLIVS